MVAFLLSGPGILHLCQLRASLLNLVYQKYFHLALPVRHCHNVKHKPVDILQQLCHQPADIRICLHGLRQLVDDNTVASCQQTFWKLIVKTTCYPQACCKLFEKIVTGLQMTIHSKPDFSRLVAT